MQAKNEMEAIKSLNEKISELEKSGTWTPVLSCLNEASPTVSLTSQEGSYLKIGKLVFVQFFVRGQITALNGTSNRALITGLPFTPKVLLNNYSSGLTISTLYNALENETNAVFALTEAGIKLQKDYGANTANWKMTNNFILSGSGCYETEA